jgi:predicted permease
MLSIWARVKTLLGRKRLEHDLDDELTFHLEMYEQKLRREGLSTAEARAEARRRFGNVTNVREEARDLWLFARLESIAQDVRYAFRSMRKSPVLAAVIVVSLALGIGANAAIFSVLDAVMLKLLPVRNPKELVLLTWSVPGRIPHEYVDDIEGDGNNEGGHFSSTTFGAQALQQIREKNQVFSNVVAYARNYDQANVAANGRAQSATLQAVSGDFFAGLGVMPIAGRAILPSDDAPSAPPVAVASYQFWQSTLGGDRSQIGKNITVNGQPATLVGVSPPEFFGVVPGRAPDLWTTLSFHIAEYRRINNFDLMEPKVWWLGMVGRLKPTVTVEQANAQAGLIFQNSLVPAGKGPSADTPKLKLQPADKGLNGLREEFSTSLLLLMGMVGVVLLIACANVGGLLLARATTRQREIAVRLSLGAPRRRIIRQLLTESTVLAVVGGAAGLVLARWATAALVALLNARGAEELVTTSGVDSRVVLFTAVISLLCGLAFGLAPAFRATRVSVFPALKQVSAAQIGSARFLSGKILSSAQVALSLLLLIAAGLLLGTLWRLQSVNIGFDRNGLITFKIEPGDNGYKGQTLIGYYEDLQRHLQAIPGVKGVGLSQLPEIGEGWSQGRAYFQGFTQPKATVPMYRHWIGPGYFEAMGIPILQGRGIEAQDVRAGMATPPDTKPAAGSGAPFVVVLNKRAIDLYMKGAAPVGQSMHTGALGNTMKMQNGIQGFGGEYTIVGIVGDVKFGGVRDQAPPTAYFSYLQRNPPPAMTFHVRYSGSTSDVTAGIQQQTLALDANVPPRDITTMTETVNGALSVERTFAFLSASFGALALALACIGLYGTIGYTVARRTSEIGVRMALGAQSGRILAMVLRETLIVVIAGVIVGLPLAWVATRLLQAQLFGLTAHDPFTIAISLVAIVLITLAAGYLPARRAAGVDPMVALRYE